MLETLQLTFSESSKNYENIKENAEIQVVNWFWASNSVYDLEPFYFEFHNFSKGKILAKTPANRKDKYEYGNNQDGEVVVVRQYISDENCYETFYQRSASIITTFRFGYSDEKRLLAIFTYQFEIGLLKQVSFLNQKNLYSEEHNNYDGNMLINSHLEQFTNDFSNSQKKVLEYNYDNLGILESIKEGNYFHYQKKTGMKLSELAEIVEKRFFEAIKQHIIENKPTEQVYCLYLYYGFENILPPDIAFGTERERKQWIEESGKDAKWQIWNPADFENLTEIELRFEDKNLFNLFNQEVEMTENYKITIKIIQNIAKKLQNFINDFKLSKTSDFVIVAADYDKSDLKKNFKTINPTLFEEFKKILI